KTATDSAGNTATASVIVYLYTGQLIGPEGGEVTSSDGRVKVIIPAGALTSPTRIRLSKIDKDTLQDTAPSGSSVLSVVECKPYGLVFNKPVELIYSLEQAQIPGTAVELGLYNSIEDKITPTGQKAVIPVDGYTVRFTLMHFSTYACLEYANTQGAPIGAGVQIPLPDLLTGSFSHAIPITSPPGRKGMQPQIGLSYRSSNPNSWVGLGFSLNSGYIVRSTRLGPPSYDDKQDTFYFITEAGTTEMVHLIDNLYQSKVESGFTKFFKEPDDTWKVVTKDGAILRFGQSTDSKETSTSGTFSWYITKAIDTNGNYIEYYYTKDQGKAYLSRIDYTGNETGVSPTNSVEFSLEPRDDIISSYISTSRIATAKRLKEVEAKVKGELVWRYELEYGYSPDSNRSLLKSVKQSGSDGKSLPQQRFNYQKAK
ncbi:MAG: SpvB/TcaC N-terminal domain-containing protein, partial [Candidatus Omnitrophota bacterium]